MNQLLLLCCFNFILSPDTNSITNYVPVEVIIPSGSHSNKLKVEFWGKEEKNSCLQYYYWYYFRY